MQQRNKQEKIKPSSSKNNAIRDRRFDTSQSAQSFFTTYEENNGECKAYKLFLIGGSQVGKSALYAKFIDGKDVINATSTIGFDFKLKYVEIGNTLVKLQIWDTSGAKRYRQVVQAYFKEPAGVMLLYNVTNRQSFEEVQAWYQWIKKHELFNKINLILVGLGIKDKTVARVVPLSAGKKLAKQYGIPFIECSVKENINVEEAFVRLVKCILQPRAECEHSSAAGNSQSCMVM